MADLEILRHSASHVLAQAVKELFPKARLGIGPSIENGFYYDFDNVKFSAEDLEKIEATMKDIIKKNLQFKKIEVDYNEAKKLLKNEPYKLELLEELKRAGEKISFYQDGDFIDLCKGPHIKSTNEIKAVKLLKLAGAYWKGSERNPMLQRIYGTAFNSEKELKEYLHNLEEAEKRDHRKLGRDLELFFFHEYSPGSAFFEPKGAFVYNELIKFLRGEYVKRGYKEVITPLIYDKELWETSGHWEHYKNDMFILNVDGREYSLKPMNCPSHILIFKNKIRSYKDLPLRLADFAPLHRNELRGVLAGLTRLRKFSQDDAHVFVIKEQLEDELVAIIDFIKFVYKDTFNFNYSIVLSTRPEKFMGDAKLWEKAEKMLENVLKKKKIIFKVNKGEGAFYGPKIDCIIKDALNREWQLATVQLDFQMPLRFKAAYEGKDGKKHTPIMIHRAILGSVDRFMGILLEHFAGKFPLWLNPVQVKIITLTDRNISYARKVKEELEKNNIRVELDDKPETIAKKVRDAETEKVNIILTIGDKEEQNKTLAVRIGNKVSFGIKLDKFISDVLKQIKNKSL